MTRSGACACGAVRFRVDGPVRDVIVCHCAACREAAGGPWAASAARRGDLAVEDGGGLVWEEAVVSACDASRGRCRTCGSYLFWDAPGRETVSFAADLLEHGDDLAVAAHIWVPEEERERIRATGVRVEAEGLPESVGVPWHGDARTTGRSRLPRL
jgi:hypothetical protein